MTYPPSHRNPLLLHAVPDYVSAQRQPALQHVSLCICPETASELEKVVVEEAELVEGRQTEAVADACPPRSHQRLFVPV